MKPRKLAVIISVILYVLFFLITAIGYYIGSGMHAHPGLGTNSFAPANVKKVPEDEDILVNVYTGHEEFEVNLNDINSGWIVRQYNGQCGLVFSYENGNYSTLYYVEIIPRERLKILDITARHKDDPTNSCNGKPPSYMSCCYHQELHCYYYPRRVLPILAIANAVAVLVLLGANILICKLTGGVR